MDNKENENPAAHDEFIFKKPIPTVLFRRQKYRELMENFREHIENQIDEFYWDTRPLLEFLPMHKKHRAIVHEAAHYAGLHSMSYGEENVNRYTVVYKRSYKVTAAEVATRGGGLKWETAPTVVKVPRRRRKSRKKKQAKTSAASQTANALAKKRIKTKGSELKTAAVAVVAKSAAVTSAAVSEVSAQYACAESESEDSECVETANGSNENQMKMKKSKIKNEKAKFAKKSFLKSNLDAKAFDTQVLKC